MMPTENEVIFTNRILNVKISSKFWETENSVLFWDDDGGRNKRSEKQQLLLPKTVQAMMLVDEYRIVKYVLEVIHHILCIKIIVFFLLRICLTYDVASKLFLDFSILVDVTAFCHRRFVSARMQKLETRISRNKFLIQKIIFSILRRISIFRKTRSIHLSTLCENFWHDYSWPFWQPNVKLFLHITFPPPVFYDIDNRFPMDH